MEEGVGEECGVSGIFFKDQNQSSIEVPHNLIDLGRGLQHRGLKSAGISVYNPYGRSILVSHKGVGWVSEVFQVKDKNRYNQILQDCCGTAGIGHTRYSTSGSRGDARAEVDEVQPFERRHGRLWKRFSLAFNGNLANYDALKGELKDMDYWLDTEVDTEVLMHLFATNIKKFSGHDDRKPDLFEVTHSIMDKLDGAYTVVSMFADGNLLAFRDPKAMRPLVWGQNERFYAVASESSALEKIGIHEFQDVRGGEAVIFNKDGVQSKRLIIDRPKPCQFEFVYFLRSKSVMDGTDVRQVRKNFGKRLADKEPLRQKLDSSYIVVPAPMTAIPAAQAYAAALGLQFEMAVEKDGPRGFINDSEERKRIMSSSYTVHSSDVIGKKVILIDDSVVRGETSRILVSEIRKAGAQEVHLRLTEPPIKFPCFYGIDYPTLGELAANQFNGHAEEGVAQMVGADSVVFQDLEGLISSIGRGDSLCTACLTGKYPTPCGQALYEAQVKR